MIKLFIREWKRGFFVWVSVVLFTLFFESVIFTLYKYKRIQLVSIMDAVMSKPVEIYQLLGFNEGVSYGNISFYLYCFIMVVNVICVGVACWQMFSSVMADERSGVICHFCNQWYSRKTIIISKLVAVLFSSLLGYIVCYIITYYFVYIGSLTKNIAYKLIQNNLTNMLEGLRIIVFFVLISAVRGIIQRSENSGSGIGWSVFCAVYLPMLGNLYKVFELVQVCLEKYNKPIKYLPEIINMLKNLYWCAPLSWINPYVTLNEGEIIKINIILTGISIVSFVVVVLLYGRRKLC